MTCTRDAVDLRKAICAAVWACLICVGWVTGGEPGFQPASNNFPWLNQPSNQNPAHWQAKPQAQALPGAYTPFLRASQATQLEAVEPIPPSPLAPGALQALPLDRNPDRNNVQISGSQDRISLAAVDAPLNVVLAMIAEQHGLNVVTGSDMSERITVKITGSALRDTLDVLLSANGYTWYRRNDILVVSKVNAEQRALGMPGRVVRLFPLNYITATDADSVAKGLLSPVGQSFAQQSLSTDHRRTHEQLLVEDLPEHVQRIAQYIAQADCPPRQVLIEAHVLQVALKGECRHGVDFEQIFNAAGTSVTLATTGFTTGVPPVASMKISGGDLTAVIECIKATTDAKTLASPQVAVLNNQEAAMQVGSKIGYLMTTTTQTSTLQSVNFLDVGVILKVMPTITADRQILIQVKPQVSTGRINSTTNLPESETTEVSTRVLLGDGEALVIGGLIKETDIESQNKVPFLGDLWLVGWMFRKTAVTRERNEIIITLLPRIIPDTAGCRAFNPVEIQRAHTPLLYGPVLRVDRTLFEPEFKTYRHGQHAGQNQDQCLNQYGPPAAPYLVPVHPGNLEALPSSVPGPPLPAVPRPPVHPGNLEVLPPPVPNRPMLPVPPPPVDQTRSFYPPPPVWLPPLSPTTARVQLPRAERAIAPATYQGTAPEMFRLPPP